MPSKEAAALALDAAVDDGFDRATADAAVAETSRSRVATATALGVEHNRVELGIDDSGVYAIVTVRTDAGDETAPLIRLADRSPEQWKAAAGLLAWLTVEACGDLGFAAPKV